jgi:hypothetical protein
VQDTSTPYADVRAVNFSGCIEEVFLGPDLVDLSPAKEGAHGVEAGCTVRVKTIDIYVRYLYMCMYLCYWNKISQKS